MHLELIVFANMRGTTAIYTTKRTLIMDDGELRTLGKKIY